MKKFLYIAATALLLTSCSEDFKDWAEPQSTPQDQVITFGNGSVTPVNTIDFSLETGETVKVCDLTAPTSSDTAYVPEYRIYLDGKAFALGEDGTVNSQELKDYVVSLYGRAPEPRVLNAQVEWVMSNGVTATTITTEPFDLTVILEPVAKPDLWYLVGSCIGDGTWSNNNGANVGVSLIPMYADPDNFSMLSYVGYFPAGQGFKLIHKPGDWGEQWGMTDGAFVKNDGGSGNIEVAADGYYRITYDMSTETVTVEPYTEPVKVFSLMAMPGDYQDWNPAGNLMTAMNTVVENHDWIMKSVTYDDTTLKFAAGSWADNWGAGTFPVGIGVANGANIPVEAGTYTVVFNDILGMYYFISE